MHLQESIKRITDDVKNIKVVVSRLYTTEHLFGKTDAARVALEDYKDGEEMGFVGYFTLIQDAYLVNQITHSFTTIDDIEESYFIAFDQGILMPSLERPKPGIGYILYGVKLNGIIDCLESNRG